MILLPLMLLWAPRPMRFATSARWGLLLFFAAALTVGAPDCLGIEAADGEPWPAESFAETATERIPANLSDPGAELSREGTRVVGLVGTLREVGRRWTFIADDNQIAYRLLENQSLERVCRAIEEDPRDVRWKISGQLTEYLDENFLLLEQTQRAPE